MRQYLSVETQHKASVPANPYTSVLVLHPRLNGDI